MQRKSPQRLLKDSKTQRLSDRHFTGANGYTILARLDEKRYLTEEQWILD